MAAHCAGLSNAHLPNCVVALATRTDWTGSNGFITHTITVRAVRLDGSYGKQHPYSKTTAAPEKVRDAGQLADVYPILGRKFTRIDLILSNFYVNLLILKFSIFEFTVLYWK